MQSTPGEIQDDLEEEPVAFSQGELAAEAEVKSKEEVTAEAKIKAEEEEVAASMREITHRAKEKALEEKESLEESIQPATADEKANLAFSKQEEKEEEPREATKKEKNVLADSKKANPIINLQHTIPANKKPPIADQYPTEPIAAVSSNSLELELVFLLGQQSISIEDLRLLAEEKIIPLGGSDFQAKILLQGKKIAEAQLVMVDKVPSLQITSIISSQ
ncbi:MAG: FliM/FliN family flagellar motor C-terminal domain-containing protein [Chthoniobacterales bacterium]|nr:FliM/FliN family flagellar motor C-terminal domain-containing protein [Chthoniobacterales bacterium]